MAAFFSMRLGPAALSLFIVSGLLTLVSVKVPKMGLMKSRGTLADRG